MNNEKLETREFLDINQAADFSTFSKWTLYHYSSTDPSFPSFKKHGKWLVMRSDLATWLQSDRKKIVSVVSRKQPTRAYT